MRTYSVKQKKNELIDWCLTPTLAVFQLYHGVNKINVILTL